ncbi:hypothetical protein [Bacillus sp. 165]|uniref:hypothetical protein n=1 Tax=Bacillus sp. 165 TaxID=1529117 RepID=UPI001AD9BA59|nr:hypothetical protein [Bacillus sp. 165]MBO9129237.1 hypothetical protein [Bacillus sp. 165]
MKRKYVWIPAMVMGALFITNGCSLLEKPELGQVQSQEEAKPVNITTQTELQKEITEVIQQIKKLNEQLKASPNQSAINQAGKDLAEKWDSFEDRVEDKYPEQYEKIEENLYPLIGETGKQKLDIQKMQMLIRNVLKDLAAFLQQLK